MLRSVYTPDSNHISVAIPDKYIGAELEILVFPVNEVLTAKVKKASSDVDKSFGGWADMDKTTEEICSEIKESRTFRNRDISLAL
jgi:hypothetical protein